MFQPRKRSRIIGVASPFRRHSSGVQWAKGGSTTPCAPRISSVSSMMVSISDRRIRRHSFRGRLTAGSGGLPAMMSAAFSPIMMVGALVLDELTSGMIEESQTRSPSMPRTLRSGPTTAIASAPILQVPDGMMVGLAACGRRSRPDPPRSSPAGRAWRSARMKGSSAFWRMISRADAQALERHRAVVRIGPVVRIDQRMRRPDRPTAAAPCRASADAERRSSASRRHSSAARRPPRCPSRGRDGTGCRAQRRLLVGLPEAAGLEQGRGDGPLLEQEILQAGPDRAMRLDHAVIGEVARAFAMT